jgi:pyruvate-formate lyase-activating enzyme
MANIFHKNCCDGLYNSFDIHFTSACDNKCSHCIDLKYEGFGIKKPDVQAIVNTIVENQNGYDDVLFLGGEPCLYLQELLDCVKQVREKTNLKIFVTTAIPKICKDRFDLFTELLEIIDGINLSVQHYKEEIADEIRKVPAKYDRQEFYKNLPYKDKIRINLNIVKPYLYTKEDITACLLHYDVMGFNSIKLSEIQHGKDYFVSFEKTFGVKFKTPFYGGCQTYLETNKITELKEMRTQLLLKRSCFMCEETLNASFMDGIKVAYKLFEKTAPNKYGVIYENGCLTKQWR